MAIGLDYLNRDDSGRPSNTTSIARYNAGDVGAVSVGIAGRHLTKCRIEKGVPMCGPAFVELGVPNHHSGVDDINNGVTTIVWNIRIVEVIGAGPRLVGYGTETPTIAACHRALFVRKVRMV